MKSSSFASRRGRTLWIAVLAVVPVAALAWVGSGSAAPTPAGSADLRITKSDSPDPVTVGSTLTYTIRVDNAGPNEATGVVVTDQLPKGVDVVSATATQGKCAAKGQKVTCELGSISFGTGPSYSGSPTVTIAVIPRKEGTITNTATVKGNQNDPVSGNNKATATTRVVGAPPTCRGVPATIAGTPGNDNLVGTGGRDVIVGLGGDDSVASFSGRDLICAGPGNDAVNSGPAADRVFGAAGRDRLLGRGGPDVLKGNAGNDVLKGNAGSDRLRGGRGIDRCRGGAGLDSIRGCER